MRYLNGINSAAKSTKHTFASSLVISVFMGLGAWALANGAAPSLPLRENYLEIFGLGIVAFSFVALPIPFIFKWNWETKYFGAGLLPFATGSILGIYPILCIALYSSLPSSICIAIVLLEAILITQWCNRFAKIYRAVYCDKVLFHYMYVEDSKEIYYLQKADKKNIEKLLRFQQFPSSKFAALSLLAAFSLVPFATPISRIFGLPFIHVFLAIGATPLNLMFLGLSTKM